MAANTRTTPLENVVQIDILVMDSPSYISSDPRPIAVALIQIDEVEARICEKFGFSGCKSAATSWQFIGCKTHATSWQWRSL